jgi:outer membrane receptor for monomeric catechols
VPTHSASLWTECRVADGLLAGVGAGAGLYCRGKGFVDSTESGSVDGFVRVDAALSYQLNEAVGARLFVRNVLGTTYVANPGQFAGLNQYGSPRAFFLSATVRF